MTRLLGLSGGKGGLKGTGGGGNNANEMVVEIRDWDALSSDDSLGQAVIDVSTLTTSYEGQWLPLKGRVNSTAFFQKAADATGEVYVRAKAVRNPQRKSGASLLVDPSKAAMVACLLSLTPSLTLLH